MATVGNTTPGAQFANGSLDRMRLVRIQTPPDFPNQATSISAYLDRSTTGTQAEFLARGVVYEDNAGVPGDLFRISNDFAAGGIVLNAAQWYTATFVFGSEAFLPNTFYWIGVAMSRPIVTYHATGAAGVGRQGDDEYDDGPAPSWTSVTNDTTQNRDYSFYLTYTADDRAGTVSHVELQTPDVFAATDSEFGFDQIGGSFANGSIARLRLTQFVAPDDINDGIDFFAYMDRTTTGASGFGVRAVVYDDNGGIPGSLMEEKTLTTNAALNSPQWYSATLDTPVSFTAGDTYWLGVHMERPVVNYYSPGQPGGTSYHADAPYSTTSPASFATATDPQPETRMYSFYLTYFSLKRGQVSFAEMEVPSPPRRGRVSFVEFEVNDSSRAGQVSWMEVTVPSTGVGAEQDYGFILRDGSDSALRDGGPVLRDSDPTIQLNRAGVVSQIELETPDVQTRARVSWIEMSTPDDTARRAALSFIEMETPELGAPLREARVSFVEMQVPNEPGVPEPGTFRRRRLAVSDDILQGRTSRGTRP